MDRVRTRERIVAKSTEVILRDGYTHTTMDAIASALGMSKKTLYQVFPSKRDLLKAVLNSLQAQVESGMEALVYREGISFRDKWISVVEFTSRQYARFGQGFVDDLRSSDPETFQILDRFRAGLVQKCFTSIAEEGIKDGAFRSGIEPKFLSEIYLAIVRAILNPDSLERLDMAPDKAYREVVALLLDGISARSEVQFQRIAV